MTPWAQLTKEQKAARMAELNERLRQDRIYRQKVMLAGLAKLKESKPDGS